MSARPIRILLAVLIPLMALLAFADAPSREEADRLFNERSYALAAEQYEKLLEAATDEPARRELRYRLGQSRLLVDATDVARQHFEALTHGPEDEWMGRAHWELEPGLTGRWYPGESSAPLEHLRIAEPILARLKIGDLEVLYSQVLNNLPNRIGNTKEKKADREYVWSYFDKIAPLLKEEARVADVALIRARLADYVEQTGNNAEMLRQMENVATEFPGTPAAARALLQLAQYEEQHSRLVNALKFHRRIVDEHPDSQEARQSRERITAILKREVHFSINGAFLPGEPVEFELRGRNLSRVELSLIPFDPIAHVRRLREQRLNLGEVRGRAVHRQTVELPSRSDHLATTAGVTIRYDKPGAYVLRATGGDDRVDALLLISSLALVSNTANHALEFWAVDARSGEPRAGVDILVAHRFESEDRVLGRPVQRFKSFADLRTDKDGFADFRDDSNSNILALARDGEHYAVGGQMWTSFSPWGRGNVGYAYTDRPVYRPGQSVHWRVIPRVASGGDFKVPDHTFDVRITDARGQELLTSTGLTLSEFGTLHGELVLKGDAPLGQYNLSAYNPQTGVGANASFRVEEYKKPEYEVTVGTDEPLVKLGSEIGAKVSAKYYFGAPVADAEVKYTVRRRPHWFPWWRMMNPLADTDLGWFDEPEQDPGRRHGSQGDIVAEGTGRTDAEGNFVFRFKAEGAHKPQGAVQVPGYGRGGGFMWMPPSQSETYDFQVETTVVDKSRRNIDGSKVIIVSDRALKLSAAAARSLYVPGDNVKVRLRSETFNNTPAATSGTLYVEKVKWIAADGREEVTTLTTTRVDIPASGSLEHTWKATPGETGCMRFLLEVEDPFGGLSHAYAPFILADESTKDIFYRFQGVDVIMDREVYHVGDTMRVLILGEQPGAQAWFWINNGSGSMEKKVIPLKDRTTFLNIPVTDSLVPNASLHVVVVRDKRLHTDSAAIVVPPTRLVATVTLETDKEEYRPGEEATVRLTARDWQGRPLKGEFSLSMFDSSILYIAADTREDVRRAFYGQRRHLSSDLRNSVDTPGQYSPRWVGGHSQKLLWSFAEYGDLDAPQSVLYDRSDAEFGHTSAFRLARGAVPASAPMPALAGAVAMEADGTVSAGDVFRTKNGVSQERFEDLAPVTVRSDFRDSMFWSPTLVTDADGVATAKVRFPDSLTTWKASAIGVATDSLVGEVSVQRTVTKKLLARLQAPRFFRERDEVVISGVIHNYLDTEQNVLVNLDVTGLDPMDARIAAEQVRIPAGGERRVDWRLCVTTPGEAKLKLVARTPEESDAMEMAFPVLPHGIDKFVAWNGSSADRESTGVTVTRADDRLKITRRITIPAERIRATSRLTVIVNPSLASVIRDALPYMIDYPYGCVEQTLNRFVPAAVAAGAFDKLGIPRDAALEARTAEATAAGLARLADFQHGDGSWGWWKDDATNPHMTALVVHGLTLARQAGLGVDNSMYERGLESVRRAVQEYDPKKTDEGFYWRSSRLNTLALQQLVLALADQPNPKANDALWAERDKLSPQSLAMLARSLWRAGRHDDARVVLRNLHNFATVTPENDTAHWGEIHRCWYWWDDAVESTAQGLLAHLEIDPDHPMAVRAMKWLALNRESSWAVDRAVPRWKSTRDTAQAVLALAQYMVAKRETSADMDFEISVAGQPPRKLHLDADNFWKFDGRIVLEGDAVPDGDQEVRITRTGNGTFFYSIFAEYFTLEEGIKSAGNEIFVERTYEKLVRKDSKTTGVLAEDTYVPIADGDTVVSGDELRVTLRIKSLNDYEYLVFEDAKPAGMEPVALQSGTVYAGFCSNMELRDQYVSFFVTRMPQGEHVVTYNCRAETPGVFHTMPTKGYAMYSPALRANSSEIVVKVVDAPAAE